MVAASLASNSREVLSWTPRYSRFGDLNKNPFNSILERDEDDLVQAATLRYLGPVTPARQLADSAGESQQCAHVKCCISEYIWFLRFPLCHHASTGRHKASAEDWNKLWQVWERLQSRLTVNQGRAIFSPKLAQWMLPAFQLPFSSG